VDSPRPGDRALAVPTDITDPASVQALFDAGGEGLGPGRPAVQQRRHQRAQHAPLEDLPIDKWKAVVDTNLSGMFYTSSRPSA
jgi:NAD(P)-dependent dehydrogenase (short-subunit alcohol dehydrogenase family)